MQQKRVFQREKCKDRKQLKAIVVGMGSSPISYSPVLSRFNMDECHVETKQSKGQKISHKILSLSITSPLFSLFKQTKPEHQTIKGIKTKGTKDVSVVLGILSFLARVVKLGSSQQKVGNKGKDGNLTPTLHNSIFLASPEKRSLTPFWSPQASIFSSQQALILVPTQLYMKNYQIKNWICFVAFFFFLWLHRTHILCPFFFFFLINSSVPFVLMFMMLRFGQFRERGKRGERERERENR